MRKYIKVGTLLAVITGFGLASATASENARTKCPDGKCVPACKDCCKTHCKSCCTSCSK